MGILKLVLSFRKKCMTKSWKKCWGVIIQFFKLCRKSCCLPSEVTFIFWCTSLKREGPHHNIKEKVQKRIDRCQSSTKFFLIVEKIIRWLKRNFEAFFVKFLLDFFDKTVAFLKTFSSIICLPKISYFWKWVFFQVLFFIQYCVWLMQKWANCESWLRNVLFTIRINSFEGKVIHFENCWGHWEREW